MLPSDRLTLARARTAIAVMFFINGTVFATWVSRIPGIKETRGLSPSRLGLALLAIGIGTVASLPLTSYLVGRIGSRRLLGASAVACCAALPLAGLAPTFPILLAALLLYGAALGAMDVAMNAQASQLEQSVGRSMMSSFHGLWSLGGMLGALAGAGFAALGVAPTEHFVIICALVATLAGVGFGGLLRGDRDVAAEVDVPLPVPALVWPSGRVVGIGAMAACGAVIEGGIADWSGVYLRETLHTSTSYAPIGFAGFSVMMMVARFTGDRLINRWGRRRLLASGPALTAAALVIALLTDHPAVAIVALGLSGLGMATVFPIAFSAAGALPGTQGHAIAAVATMAYGAGLLGPPVIGFVADLSSLRLAMGLMVPACLTITLLSRRLSL